MKADSSPTIGDKCWRQVGAWGNQTCQELKTHVHCHNCPVYVESGRYLFNHKAPEGYLEDWREVLASEHNESEQSLQSVMVFQVAEEWIALDTVRFVEVSSPRKIHRVPHLRKPGFLGIVNLRGRLLLCLSLARLFDIPSTTASENNPDEREGQLIIIEKEGERWAAVVTRVEGIFRFSPEEVTPPPVTVAKAANTFTKGIIKMNDRTVAWLDEELLFHHLKSNLF